jgi:aminoglycoside phosphotransferase (APT) family kinase protein
MHNETQQEAKLTEYASFIVREMTGASPIRIQRIRRGVMTYKWRVSLTDHEEYIVRVYPSSRSHVVNYEPDIFRKCREKGIPLPKTIGDSRTRPEAPLAYVVYAMVGGTPLSDKLGFLSVESLDRVARDLVVYLQMLQGVSVRGYGELVSGDTARFPSWVEFVRASFVDGISRARSHRLLSLDDIAKLNTFQAELEHLDIQGTCGVAWGDISPENILIGCEGEITGLLDFEGALAADFMANLGYCFSGFYGTPFLESIIRAWPVPLTERSWHTVKLYATLRAVRILEHGHEPLPVGYTRSDIKELLPGFRAVLKEMDNW